MADVVERNEFNVLLKEVESLKKRVAMMDAGMGQIEAINEWLNMPAARNLYKGRHGNPVGRKTFKKMVDKWIADGLLIEGVNYHNYNGRRFIANSFFKAKAA